MAIIKGNKGEWSELYVFLKLLAEGKLFQSNMNLEKDGDKYYEIVKAYREESSSILEFERLEKISFFRITKDHRELIKTFDVDFFKSNADLVLNGIINGEGKSFEIAESANFFQQTEIKKLTALVASKSDIKLRIYDYRLAKETDLGFSIKSFLGGDSTLLNTGPGNNFIYEADKSSTLNIVDFNAITYKPKGGISKITCRLKELDEIDISLKFKEIQSKQFWMNLKMIDGDLPDILAYSLLYRWTDRDSSVYNVAKKLEERDPLNFYNGKVTEQKLYEYKLKKLLAESAMGMTSETPWHGIYDATGGIIIAKKDGDVVCFHIYDFNLFREYLLKNTVFEQPSTGEEETLPGTERTSKGTKKFYYGWLFEEDEKFKFKINLQIRFR